MSSKRRYVVAGMARSGSVYKLELDPAVLMTAFQNTVELLKAQIIVARPTEET